MPRLTPSRPSRPSLWGAPLTISPLDSNAIRGPSPVAITAGAAAAAWAIGHRRSTAVRQWRPPILAGQRYGDLHVRSGGNGGPTVLLLHGLLATGDAFGVAYDALANTRRVIVPDLLGFGRSLDEDRTAFGPEQHLDALDNALQDLDVADDLVIVGAHSMGAAVALRWAARHPQLIERIICWGPPLYPAHSTVGAALADTGPMARLLATDTPWARRLCAWSCRHRQLAGWVTALATPALPSPIARSSPLHTWPAYRAAMDELVLATHWDSLIGQLAEQGIGIRLVWGANDTIGDQALGRSLATAHSSVEVDLVAGADHHLPLTHPETCIGELTTASRGDRTD